MRLLDSQALALHRLALELVSARPASRTLLDAAAARMDELDKRGWTKESDA